MPRPAATLLLSCRWRKHDWACELQPRLLRPAALPLATPATLSPMPPPHVSCAVPATPQELSDGAVTAFLPPPIPPAEALALDLIGELRSIGVCAVPADSLGSEFLGQQFEVHISPSLQRTPRFSFLKLSVMGLLPFSASEGEELFELGYQDTMAWAAAEYGEAQSELIAKASAL